MGRKITDQFYQIRYTSKGASHETDVKKIWISKHSIKSTIHLPFFVAKNDKEHDEAVSIRKGEKKSKHMDIYGKKGSGYKR